MVIQTTINGITAYLHAAYATDENGTDFSLTDFDGAVYVGNYTDTSATESTNYKRYAWQLIGNAEIDADEIEDYEELEPIEVAEVSDSLDSLDNTTGNLQAQIDENKADAVITQTSNDEGIGNVNMLAGTNQGVTGWTASANLTISAMNSPIYEETSDAVNFVRVTCDLAGSNYILFDASYLRSVLAELTDDNSFTFSADVRMSTVFEIGTVAVQDVDETNAQIEFDEITNEAIDEDTDNNGAWVHNISTSNVINDNAGDPIPESAQFLYFDLSQMGAGETLDIANLKIEAGAIATPWRASLDEVEATANAALNAANTVTNHFWYDSAGAHITEATQADYIADPTNAGGNTLITSSGMDVRNGTDTLASFGSSGAQVGQSGSGHTTIAASGMQVFGNNGSDSLANIGYGAGSDVSGGTSNAPYYTLGTRDTSQPIGNYSLVSGRSGAATKYGSSSLGIQTQSLGLYAQSENYLSSAQGESSHAEGMRTYALADYSHSQNYNTIANGEAQTAIGKYNISDTTSALIIGNGASGARSNALTVDWSGNVDAAGTVTVGRDPTSALEVATKQYVDGLGFGGTATQLQSGTLTSSSTSKTLTDNISNYKFISFRCVIGNFASTLTVPVDVLTESTTVYQTVTVRNGATDTRYGWFRYNNDTTMNVYASINNGLNYVIYGIK